jgi:multiple sugar transport system permease protein
MSGHVSASLAETTARRRPSRWRYRRLGWGLFFVSPWLIGFLAFVAAPILASLYFSFTRYDVLTPPRLVGLQNFQDLLDDRVFWQAVYNSVFYVVFAVPGHAVVGFSLAYLLDRRLWARPVWRTIFFLPAIVPAVAAATIWAWIYNSEFGLLNSVLNSFGVPSVPWLSSEALVKPSLIVISLWSSGAVMVIYLAALQDVPQHLYDAARIDGASWYQELRYLTIPLVSPATVFVLVTGLIGAFQYFTFPYLLTRGGPVNASLFYPLYLYFNSFQWFKMGYASAMAWIMFVLTVLCAIAIFRSSARWAYYQAEERV